MKKVPDTHEQCLTMSNHLTSLHKSSIIAMISHSRQGGKLVWLIKVKLNARMKDKTVQRPALSAATPTTIPSIYLVTRSE